MERRVDFNKHFHTEIRPVDSQGKELKPLDIVRIDSVPAELYADEGLENLAGYQGKYGLVSYFLGKPHYYGKRDHPGWVSPDASRVCILSRKVSDERSTGLRVITSWDFWLEPKNLTRLPYNSLIMNVFADYPWQMLDDIGPSDHHFVVEGMEQFEYLERILETPYDALVSAHESAMDVLARVT